MIKGSHIVAATCAICATVLLATGHAAEEGWGWLLFIAIVAVIG